MDTKPILRALLPVALVGAAAYGAIHYDLLPTSAFWRTSCAEPLTYTVGAIDERFNVSEAELAVLLAEAAELWNDAAGRTVIAAAEKGKVRVNMAYDERQAAVTLGRTIDAEQAAYDAKKASVEEMREEYLEAKSRYETLAASFERDSDAYEQEVAYWNDRGGAPPAEYRALEAKRRALETKQERVQSMVDEVNSIARELNGRVDELNQLARKTNRKVNTYNAAVGEDFDQGNYVSDKERRRITIFEFETRAELKRVLAHEFGHALGIGHTENPESIMYSYNVSEGFTLAPEDVAALKETCRLE